MLILSGTQALSDSRLETLRDIRGKFRIALNLFGFGTAGFPLRFSATQGGRVGAQLRPDLLTSKKVSLN